MKGFTLALLSSLLLASEVSLARPGVYHNDQAVVERTKISRRNGGKGANGNGAGNGNNAAATATSATSAPAATAATSAVSDTTAATTAETDASCAVTMDTTTAAATASAIATDTASTTATDSTSTSAAASTSAPANVAAVAPNAAAKGQGAGAAGKGGNNAAQGQGQGQGQRQGQGNAAQGQGQGQGNNGGNGGNGQAAAAAAASSSSAPAAASTSATAAGGNTNNNGNTATSTTAAAAAAASNSAVAVNENGKAGPAVPVLQVNDGTTLDKTVIQNTAANANATAGQAASATSDDNFINFCSGQTITNGLQVKTGSCNPIVMGQIPSTQNMVTTMFTSPANGDTVKAGQTFTVGLMTSGITMGSFTDAQANYYAAPQQLDSSGQIVGHAHVVIQQMKSTTDTSLLDPNTFNFFKGLDNADVNGLSTIDVQGGLEAGAYRLCTIMSASNHQSVVMPIAQRGAENTCSYFNVA